MNIEGYWRQSIDQKSDLPWPIPNVLDQTEIADLFLKLSKVQDKARKTRYKGLSESRLDGSFVGCAEYTYKNWTWPEGLAYYLQHGVALTPEFIKFLNEESK